MPITPPVITEVSLSAEEREQVETLLKKAACNSRIQCSGALAIATSLKISSHEVGRIANKLDIKISGCQLGCF